MPSQDRVDDVRDRLASIAEELADLALERLAEAVADGATKAPDDEKRITRARRAVEKAVALLDEPQRGGAAGDD